MIFHPCTGRMNAESRVNLSSYFRFKYHWKQIYRAVCKPTRAKMLQTFLAQYLSKEHYCEKNAQDSFVLHLSSLFKQNFLLLITFYRCIGVLFLSVSISYMCKKHLKTAFNFL